MPDIAVVDAWGFDGGHDLVAMISAIDKSVIPKSIVPGVPDYFFLSDTGSGVHLAWGIALLVSVLVNDSVWATKSMSSSVPDTYIKPDATRQIFSVSRVYAQGGRAVFESDLPGMHFSIKLQSESSCWGCRCGGYCSST
jgi:hypothetical protein